MRGAEMWGMQEGESPKAFASFCVYRDMGPERSFDGVRQRTGKQPWYKRQIERWADRYEWAARASAYDAHMDSVRRGGYEDAERSAACRAYLERVRKSAAEVIAAGQLCLEVASRSLKAYRNLPPETLTPGDAAGLIRSGVAAVDYGLNAEAVALGLSETLSDA
jgi:hypothetical protein